MRRLAVLALLALTVACRTARPAGTRIVALTATTPEHAIEQLRAQRAEFGGMRSLMRVRATTNGKTQSFRAQLAVHDARRMELIAYTPVGTTALKMTADGDRITTDPPVAPEAFAFLRETGLTPAETGMLLLGLPPHEGMQVDVQAGGLASATAGGIRVVYDPPAFPAKRVVVTRGDDRVEIEHEEVVREN
ncbi:MAG TPA: DUF3261 domain-containing protein [Thermoanaerobaculia bacterium]|nr:DUF3261 domain-containing protein [Thermoanaerobaculia bacterium]